MQAHACPLEKKEKKKKHDACTHTHTHTHTQIQELFVLHTKTTMT